MSDYNSPAKILDRLQPADCVDRLHRAILNHDIPTVVRAELYVIISRLEDAEISLKHS